VNLAMAATTFALVIPAELPDKTFVACLVLSSRHRPVPVWCGAVAALVLQAGIVVVAGGLIALLPKPAVQSVVTALFLGGAVYLLATTEHAEQERGELLASGEDRSLAAGSSFWRVAAVTFGVVAIAEFGDITQVLIANLAAHYRDRAAVFAGATAGFALGHRRRGPRRPHDHALGASHCRTAGVGTGPFGLRHLHDRLARHELSHLR